MGKELDKIERLRLQYNVFRQIAAGGEWESEQEGAVEAETDAWLDSKAWAQAQADAIWKEIAAETGEKEPTETVPVEKRETPEEVEDEVAAILAADEAKPSVFAFELQPEIMEKDHDSAKVTFKANDFCKAFIRYGEKGGSKSQRTTGEKSFDWQRHVQLIEGLHGNTVYEAQVHAEDDEGKKITSEVFEFTTDKAPARPTKSQVASAVAKGFPANADASLPMGGIFLGATHGGLQTGNTTLAVEHSFRFRAEMTGTIDAIRFENRLLNQSNIDNRTSPDFRNCKNNNLPPNVCSYTLGNSYHVGNGGQLVATVHPDNGRGQPNESVVLGKVSEVYIPANVKSGAWKVQYMVSPIPVVMGQLYHIMLKNLKPPVGKLYRNSNAEAWAKPKDGGAISLNGVWHGDYVGPDHLRWGPFYGRNGQGMLYRNDIKGRWYENKQTFGWMEILYGDGKWRGDALAGYDNIHHQKLKVRYAKQEGYKVVGGARRVRQTFIPQVAQVVNGMWLSFLHSPECNMQPLKVELKKGSRTVATGSIGASKAVRDRMLAGKKNGSIGAINANTWGYCDLAETVLDPGEQYFLEMSAPGGAGFHINSFFHMHKGNHHEWHNAFAEFNSGSGWGVYDRANGRSNRDLPILFTLKGMPKHL